MKKSMKGIKEEGADLKYLLKLVWFIRIEAKEIALKNNILGNFLPIWRHR